MRRLILCVLLAALVAAPAVAYIQVGHLPKTHAKAESQMVRPGELATLEVLGPLTPTAAVASAGNASTADPSRPMPEPGTMALASMGLLALGAAAHRRRGG